MDLPINSTYAWLIIGAIFVIVEIMTPSFGPLLLAIGATLAAASSYFGAGWVVQVLTFAITSILTLVLLRPKIVNILYKSAGVPERVDALIGKVGIVTEAIHPIKGTGRVTVDGQDWAAEANIEIESGETVRIRNSNGIKLIVTPERRGI
jgi:membrane protein implicated in regulation of membrane protease activity